MTPVSVEAGLGGGGGGGGVPQFQKKDLNVPT
jgi:hypothetical protein